MTTARVTAKKYCNLAVLQKDQFMETLNSLPGVKEVIFKRIYKYNDSLLKFIKKSIKRVPYFKNLEEECLASIIYALDT